MTNSFKYLQNYKHMTRDSYPYTAQEGRCKYDESDGVTNVKSFKTIQSGDVDGHIAALQNQPISIAIAAASSAIMLYKGGILSSTGCGTNLDHAVNLVGYGSENGKDFWIIRNSWGTSWGEKGYLRVARSDRDGPGICGILKMSSYPIL
jgi:C1A family cysteine protease